MNTVKIVIGANFGDEGKGLMTDYFANQAINRNESCLVVCHNGGSQKGHTVVTPEGIRHVFHHFGSGSIVGADTYLSKDYIINPIIYNKEYTELIEKGIHVKCFVDVDCIVTTPYDMLLNHIIERSRDYDKHGSCGLGIYETILRSKYTKYRLTIKDLISMTRDEIKEKLNNIFHEYFYKRLRELNIENIAEDLSVILDNDIDKIRDNFILDCDDMINNQDFKCSNYNIIHDYDYVIFEGAQGLLLDQNNIEYYPHLTPSNTGIKNPLELLGDFDRSKIEVCYVTRTYMTRHGAGKFYTECRKEEINRKMIDKTNVPNEFQDILRYGFLNVNSLYERIILDIGKEKVNKSIAITHCDEYDFDLLSLRLFKDFGKYMFNGETRDNRIM